MLLNTVVQNQLISRKKLDGVGPVDNRPLIHQLASPLCPIGQIHQFAKIVVSLEPLMRF